MQKTIRELNSAEIDAVSGGDFGDYSDLGYGWWDGFWIPWIDHNNPADPGVTP